PMPRFVILEHDHPYLHWDLLLESGESLRGWRLANPPGSDGRILAEPLPDHRLVYLDYEGPVSGDRGAVKRWDAGEYMPLAKDPEGESFRFEGGKWRASATISSSEGATWLIVPPDQTA